MAWSLSSHLLEQIEPLHDPLDVCSQWRKRLLIERAVNKSTTHELQGHLGHRQGAVAVKLQQLCIGCAVAQLLCK